MVACLPQGLVHELLDGGGWYRSGTRACLGCIVRFINTALVLEEALLVAQRSPGQRSQEQMPAATSMGLHVSLHPFTWKGITFVPSSCRCVSGVKAPSVSVEVSAAAAPEGPASFACSGCSDVMPSCSDSVPGGLGSVIDGHIHTPVARQQLYNGDCWVMPTGSLCVSFLTRTPIL